MLAKFHGNILNLSENIAKRFRGGATFLTHTVVNVTVNLMMVFIGPKRPVQASREM